MKDQAKKQNKLSRNWKLRAGIFALAPVGLVATTMVVACGVNNRSEITKTDLKDLNLKTSLSIPVTDQQTAFDLFVKMNPNITDLRDNLVIIGFNIPGYDQTGSLRVQARVDSKYTGTLTVMIPELNKTDLALLVNTTIEDIVREVTGSPGNPAPMTADAAFQAFLTVNSSWVNLSDVVEYGEYKPASFTDGNGFLMINAKANTAFKGSVKVIVKLVVNATNLNEVIRMLSFDDLFNFKVPQYTKQEDLISILNQEVKTIYLNKYGSFANNILDINTVSAREYPTQNQLDTLGAVWKPSRFDMDGKSWSSLRLYVDIACKDGTHQSITVYDVECSITIVEANS